MYLLLFLWINNLFHPNRVNGQKTYTISENQPPNTRICDISTIFKNIQLEGSTIRAVDSGFKKVDLDVVRESDDVHYLITKTTLDREELCKAKHNIACVTSVSLSIMVDGKAPEFDRINLQIADQNDNKPKFSKSEQILEIAEDTNVGFQTELYSAVDPDEGINAITDYILVASGDNANMFSLENKKRDDGVLFPVLHLDRKLDRELKANYTLILRAIDGERGKLNRNHDDLELVIIVTDVNDNEPKFNNGRSSDTLEIPESTPVESVIYTVQATDNDALENAKILYSFGPGTTDQTKSYFSVGKESGEIKLKTKLSYQDATTHEIYIIASDSGSPQRKSTFHLSVNILDVNDHKPDVQFICLTCIPYEGRPNAFLVNEDDNNDDDKYIGYFVVSDKDEGGDIADLSRNMKQMVETDAEIFKLKFNKGQAMINVRKPLNRETVAHYSTSFSVVDNGKPQKQTVVKYDFFIADVNDNQPLFKEGACFSLSIKENSMDTSNFPHVQATDDDEGPNAEVSYSLIFTPEQMALEDYITINKTSGKFILLKPLDRELFETLYIKIRASDAGDPPKNANCKIQVKLLDENDNAPRWVNPNGFDVGISEGDYDANYNIITLSAKDPDLYQGGEVSYSVIHDPSNLFYIDSTTGQLRLKRSSSFDYESKDPREYTLKVNASDRAPPYNKSPTTVRIFIKDRNDHLPKIEFPKVGDPVDVPWDAYRNYIVTKVRASDEDEIDQGKLTFVLYGSSNSHRISLFRINSTSGVVLPKRNFTYEDQGNYNIRIGVMDSLGKDGAVYINVPFRITNQTIFNDSLERYHANQNGPQRFGELPKAIFVLIGGIGIIILVLIILWICCMVVSARRHSQNKRTRQQRAAQREFYGQKCGTVDLRPNNGTLQKNDGVIANCDASSDEKDRLPFLSTFHDQPDKHIKEADQHKLYCDETAFSECDPMMPAHHLRQDSISSEHSLGSSRKVGEHVCRSPQLPRHEDSSPTKDSKVPPNALATFQSAPGSTGRRSIPDSPDKAQELWLPRYSKGGKNTSQTMPRNPGAPANRRIDDNYYSAHPQTGTTKRGSNTLDRRAPTSNNWPPPPSNKDLQPIQEDGHQKKGSRQPRVVPDICLDVCNSLDKAKSPKYYPDISFPKRIPPSPGIRNNNTSII